MTFLELRKKLKIELKSLAKSIRTLKSQRKAMKGYVSGLLSTQEQFRSKHAAYCMLAGRSFDQIEQKWREPTSRSNLGIKAKADELLLSYKSLIVE